MVLKVGKGKNLWDRGGRRRGKASRVLKQGDMQRTKKGPFLGKTTKKTESGKKGNRSPRGKRFVVGWTVIDPMEWGMGKGQLCS